MTLRYGILTLETSDCFLLPEHFEKSSSGGFEMKFPFFEAEWNVWRNGIKPFFFYFLTFSVTYKIEASVYDTLIRFSSAF